MSTDDYLKIFLPILNYFYRWSKHGWSEIKHFHATFKRNELLYPVIVLFLPYGKVHLEFQRNQYLGESFLTEIGRLLTASFW